MKKKKCALTGSCCWLIFTFPILLTGNCILYLYYMSILTSTVSHVEKYQDALGDVLLVTRPEMTEIISRDYMQQGIFSLSLRLINYTNLR